MIALFAAHTGAHVAAAAPLLPPLPLIFRRAVAAVRRKPAVPARLSGAGAATPPDGLPVLGGRMLSDVRREHDQLSDAEITALRPRRRLPRADGEIVIGQDEHVSVRPVNGRNLGTLPRREPMRREPGKPPWYTMAHPVYGQAPVAEVLAAEQEGQVMMP